MLEFFKKYSEFIKKYGYSQTGEPFFKAEQSNLERIYKQITFKDYPSNCSSCFIDNFYKMCNCLNINVKQIATFDNKTFNDMIEQRYILKKEVGVIFFEHNHYSNESTHITAEIGQRMLAKFGKDYFEHIPFIAPIQSEVKKVVITESQIVNDFEKMTLKELKAFADKNNINYDFAKNKKALIILLQNI